MLAADRANPRKQPFDADPKWDALNNRLVPDPPPMVKEDFGYSSTKHAGGEKVSSGEYEIDMADVAEDAQQRSYDWWQMMTSLRQTMLNLTAAGLFHLLTKYAHVDSWFHQIQLEIGS